MNENKGERRKNEWEISERETEHERLLTLGNELGVVDVVKQPGTRRQVWVSCSHGQDLSLAFPPGCDGARGAN